MAQRQRAGQPGLRGIGTPLRLVPQLAEVALVGLRFGATIAARVAAARDDVAVLVAAGPVVSGRLLMREQQSFARMLRVRGDDDPPDADEIDGHALNGFFVSTETGNNAIIVESGAAATITPELVAAAEDAIASARVFLTQLEQPVESARRGLEIARRHGVVTVFNPAPALAIDPAIYALSDYVTPNETEASAITGVKVVSVDDARRAGDALLKLGAKTALITLGEQGALLHEAARSVLVPSFKVNVVETTGAGDAFNGAFAVALGEGRPPEEAVRFACATAALSVTRRGTAPSMPARGEIDALLAGTA